MKIPSGALRQRGHRDERSDPPHRRGCLTDSRAPSQGLILRLGRGLSSAVPGVSCSLGVSTRYWRGIGFSSEMVGRGKENCPNPDRGYSRFRGLRAFYRCNREFASDCNLDILPEGRYFHLECLLKNNANASNCCRGPWTC